jgi:cytidyltransferase-like protein
MPRGAGIGKRVVFTDGVFDLLHANHVAFLEEAKSFGDWLVVGVVSDSRAKDYKRRPILSQEERLRVVEALSCVDEAFIIHDALAFETMERIIADYAVTAVVYAGDSTPEFYIAAERLGIMHRLPYRSGVNSSEIIRRIVSRNSL